MEAYFAEKVGVKRGLLQDITGGVETARIGLGKAFRVAAVISLANAAVDLDFTLRQHDAAAAGNSKDLVLENLRYFVKLDGETKFTEKTLENLAQIQDAALNGAGGTVIVEVLAEELDRDGGFNHISGLFTQGATARVACVEFMADVKDLPAYDVEL